jgi:hypothetical protein
VALGLSSIRALPLIGLRRDLTGFIAKFDGFTLLEIHLLALTYAICLHSHV